ncbi:MAG TPA: peptidylprolyl isomerase [Burkholderiales bacterium]
MKNQIFVLAWLLPALLSGPALAQTPAKESKPAAKDGPLATVNGTQVPRTRADLVVRQQVERGAPDNDQLRAQVREALINNELLIQEANRSGVSKKAEVQQQVDLARQEVIANAMVAEYLRTHPIADADIQKEYDRAKASTGDKEYKARHILVANEDDAKSVLADLKKGTKFEEIAQKRSLDEGTRPRGGDLDWNVPSNFDKAFADAMVKLEKGKMTEAPVHSRFGYHIIQLDDVRPVNFPPMAQVKPQIQQRLVAQRVDVLIKDLRAKAKIE